MKVRSLNISIGWWSEKLPLLLYLVIAYLYCFDRQSFPSLDGPAHFHNSILLKEYFTGNETVRSNFELTPFYIPNLFSNYLITAFSLFLSYGQSAFLFFFSFYFLFLYSSYYLLKSYQVRFSGINAIAFSIFFNGTLLNLGFYNFSWSVIFLFFGLGFYRRNFINRDNKTLSKYAVYLVILFFLYYSNALTLVFFSIYIAITECVMLIKNIKQKNKTRPFVLHLLKLSLFSLPCAILLFIFYTHSTLNKSTGVNDYVGLNTLLLNFGCIIVYSFEAESECTAIMFSYVALLFLYSILQKVKTKSYFELEDIFLLVSLILLYLYYHVWDQSSVGMMSTRLQYFFFLFLVIWLLVQKTDMLKLIVVSGLSVIAFYKYENKQKDTMKILESSAHELVIAGKYVEPNSTVMAINYSEQWLMAHFSNYLGVEKPLIITDNYEAVMGWFPLRWKADLPTLTFANSIILQGPRSNNETQQKVQYVVIYGGSDRVKENKVYDAELNSHYKLIYRSLGRYVAVYKLLQS